MTKLLALDSKLKVSKRNLIRIESSMTLPLKQEPTS